MIHKLFSMMALALMITAGAAAQGNVDTKDYDWARYGCYASDNAKLQKRPLVVLMGDSITEGWARQDGDWLKANNFLGRGISGQTTCEMLARFRQDVIDLKPRYVAILAGINDLARNNGKIEPENIYGNIISMVELARANKVKPVICSILPANKIGWRKFLGNPTPQILEINAKLQAYAKAHKIPYVDYYGAMVTGEDGALNPDYALDAVHPNLEGYHVMERVLLQTVRF